jgi:hypothetical protein
MPTLVRELTGAQPVDQHGTVIGPTVTLPAGSEFAITIRKLKRPDNMEELWCEILHGGSLYRVPLRLFEVANAA